MVEVGGGGGGGNTTFQINVIGLGCWFFFSLSLPFFSPDDFILRQMSAEAGHGVPPRPTLSLPSAAGTQPPLPHLFFFFFAVWHYEKQDNVGIKKLIFIYLTLQRNEGLQPKIS